MESDISASLNVPELMISQSFNLLKSLTSGKIERIEIRLKLFRVRTNILFCESEDLCKNGSVEQDLKKLP